MLLIKQCISNNGISGSGVAIMLNSVMIQKRSKQFML